MGTRSFVDVYEQMINRHNKKAMNSSSVENQKINDYTDVIGQEDDDQQEEQDQDDEPLTLSDDEGDDQEVQDEEEDIEGDEDQDEEFDLSLGDEQLGEEPQTKYNPQNYGQENAVDLNFSVELATEFSNTVNEFTKRCAQIVKNRSVKKTTSDDLDRLIDKIKNIIKAAQKSV